MTDLELKTKGEWKAFLRKWSGAIPRFSWLTSGITEADDGEFVLYKDYLERTEKLKERIKTLEAEASNGYAEGYTAGKYDGPDYNMRNN